MFPISRIISVIIVLSAGTTALLLCAWYTLYVAGHEIDGSTGSSWALFHQRGTQIQHYPSRTTSGRNSIKPYARVFSLSSSSAATAAAAAGKVQERYAVIIDAGSSGSRIHVYAFRPEVPRLHGTAVSYPVIRLPGLVQRVTPGLSEFAPVGQGVEESLEPLIKFARAQVPASLHVSTPIRLLGTAGLRLLPEDQREAVLEAVRGLLAGSGFKFRPEWARVISGDEEGLFAWAGINYAAGRLQALAQERAISPRQRDPASLAGRAAATTLAVLELGGASMQLTLMPWEPLPMGLGTALALPGVDRPLYTHSFLGYGLQVAWFREAMLVQQGGENATDPCLHPGYTSDASGVVGSGSFEECAALAKKLLQASSATTTNSNGNRNNNNGGCSYVRCSIGDEYLPLLAPEEQQGGYGNAALLDFGSRSKGSGFKASGCASSGYLIMATESFYYTMDRLGLPANASLESIRTAGRRFCSRPWADVEQELGAGRGVSEEHILKVCFGSAYIYTLLQQGFQMGPRQASYLRFSNRVERSDGSLVEVNWVLGALLVELTSKQLYQPQAGRFTSAAGSATGLSGSGRLSTSRSRSSRPSVQPQPPSSPSAPVGAARGALGAVSSSSSSSSSSTTTAIINTTATMARIVAKLKPLQQKGLKGGHAAGRGQLGAATAGRAGYGGAAGGKGHRGVSAATTRHYQVLAAASNRLARLAAYEVVFSNKTAAESDAVHGRRHVTVTKAARTRVTAAGTAVPRGHTNVASQSHHSLQQNQQQQEQNLYKHQKGSVLYEPRRALSENPTATATAAAIVTTASTTITGGVSAVAEVGVLDGARCSLDVDGGVLGGADACGGRRHHMLWPGMIVLLPVSMFAIAGLVAAWGLSDRGRGSGMHRQKGSEGKMITGSVDEEVELQQQQQQLLWSIGKDGARPVAAWSLPSPSPPPRRAILTSRSSPPSRLLKFELPGSLPPQATRPRVQCQLEPYGFPMVVMGSASDALASEREGFEMSGALSGGEGGIQKDPWPQF